MSGSRCTDSPARTDPDLDVGGCGVTNFQVRGSSGVGEDFMGQRTSLCRRIGGHCEDRCE